MDIKNKTHHACIPREIQLRAAMARLGTVDDQIQEGYEILRKHHKTVTVFGSARLNEDSIYYQQARQLGGLLVNAGYTVITGGGPGIMEAANRGAFEAGGESIGFNIVLPHEQSGNPYTTESLSFRHFSPRKIVMTMMADAYIYFPGGFGTLDEFLEILTLTQTKKINSAPIILYDRKFWGNLDSFFQEKMLNEQQLISGGDEKIYTITEDLGEIMQIVQSNDTYCKH